MSTADHIARQVRLTYFKPSGKWYATEIASWFVEVFYQEVPERGRVMRVYTPALVDEVKRRNAERELPGLSTGAWDGPILVECEDSVTHLIPAVPR